MSVHYGFIARDSDMVVFEILINKEMNPRQIRSDSIEILSAKEKQSADVITKMNSSTNKADSESPEESMELFCEPLTRITGGVELNLLLQSGVFFGIVTDLNYGSEKSKRFL